MARNDIYLNINSLSVADAVVTGQQDMTAATIPELVLGDTPTFNFYFTDNTNVWPSWAGNASYSLTWALSDAVSGDFAPAATTGNATPITGGWSVVLPLNSYDLVGLLNGKRIGQSYPVQNLWQQLRVTDPSGNEVTRAMVWTPVRYRAISDTQNTESASPTGGRFVTVNNTNELTTPTAAQFYAANEVPTSALGTAANGELLIGNGTGFTKSTLTAGTGVTITNGSGSVTIDATGAQEVLTATIKNAESIAITKGQVVYLFGATGNMASVKLAYNTSDATSAKTFGVVADASISAGGTGTVTCVGVLDGLNLGAYNEGDTLYLGATAGSVTATKPYAPNHLVYVGIVERANNGNGEMYVKIQNGYELDEIHDVQINAPRQSGQTLIYDNTLSLWKNARITAGSNIAVTNGDSSISIGFSGTLPVANGGTGVTTSTGTGSVVLSNTPTLTTPNIGAATGTSVNLSGSGTFGGNLTVSGQIRAPYTADGSPGFSFSPANDIGISSFDGTSLRFAVAGTRRFLMSSDSTLYGEGNASSIRLASTGFVNVTAGGTNQNITLTPSGTGIVSVAGNLTVSGGTIGTAASTNLTLNGGSSGANLVLGSGTNGAATVTSNGSGRTTFTTPRTNVFGQLFTNSGTVAANDRVGFLFGFNGLYANSGIAAQILDNGSTGAEDVVIYSGTNATGAGEVARFKNTGNLLVGGTTDISGSGGLKVFGTTASTSTTSGALQVAGGVGVAGALYSGSSIRTSGAIVTGGASETSISGAALLFQDGSAIRNSNGNGTTYLDLGDAVNWRFGNSSAGQVWIKSSLASTSTTTGCLRVDGGVGVAGAINAGGSLVINPLHTVARKIEAQIAHSVSTEDYLRVSSNSGTTNTYGGEFGYGLTAAGSPEIRFNRVHAGTVTNWLTVPTSTGNATFAGAIAIGNTVNTVSPTSPNRTITMVIGGTTYYLHAKTTND